TRVKNCVKKYLSAFQSTGQTDADQRERLLAQLLDADAYLRQRLALVDRDLDQTVHETPQHTRDHLQIADLRADRAVALPGGERLDDHIVHALAALDARQRLRAGLGGAVVRERLEPCTGIEEVREFLG